MKLPRGWLGTRMVRALFEARSAVRPPPCISDIREQVKVWPAVKVTVESAPAARLFIYSPVHARNSPVLFWIHGGGFLAHSASSVADYSVMMANQGYVVASLDYTLAPGARYPVPIKQANAALGYVASRIADYGGDQTRIFVGGDSAGAQMASQLVALHTNPSLAQRVCIDPVLRNGQLRGTVLYCGFYDMRTVDTSGFPALRTCLRAYTGCREWWRAPFINELSTVQNLTSDYPATFLTVGDGDPFEAQGKEFAAALAVLGVPVDGLFWRGSGAHLGHEYQFDYRLPQAEEAFRRTLVFLERNAR